jgi:CTP synthase
MTENSVKTKFIIVTGGVISGLGKGVAAASIGALLSDRLKVVPVKCDGYLNTDPGTMNPIEHGEVYVLDDGGEVDMDFGHYERFLNITTRFKWNLTMGKVFKEILEKERRGEFLGKTVQFIPHVTNLIKQRLFDIAKEEQADIMLIEVGGTVGDLENQFYLEAVRQLKHDAGVDNSLYVHLTYVPIPSGVGEQKSKPTQMSVKELNEKGIYPDVIIGRCSEYLSPVIKQKIALFCNMEPEEVISGVDVNNIYEIPLIYAKEGLPEILHKKLRIYSPPDFVEWTKLVNNISSNFENPRKTLTIAICGKYVALEDSYASVVEAVRHSAAHLDLAVSIQWIDTELLDNGQEDVAPRLAGIDAVIVPGGFGTRGIEGKIRVIRYVRENNIPFLGICYGMQLAVVEYARNVCGITGANTAEVLADGCTVEDPVVDLLPWQKEIQDKGATMRLGGHDVVIKAGSVAEKVYQSQLVRERFRHRYEVNPQYVARLASHEGGGLVFSGKAANEDIVQIMELQNHPYFVGGQFHPELKSTLLKPAPLFLALLQAADERK